MYPSLNPRGTVVYSKDAPAFTVEKLEELKQKTKVGSMIKFKTTVLEDGISLRSATHSAIPNGLESCISSMRISSIGVWTVGFCALQLATKCYHG